MKPNSILMFLLLSIAICAPVQAGTVDNATLDPAYNFTAAGTSLTYNFSATNDESFVLKSYEINIGYDEGLQISNLLTTPPATTASIDSRKRRIKLAWSTVGTGVDLQASFDVMGDTGTYTLIPARSTYTDYDKNSYNGTCNTVQVEFTSPLPPVAPHNVRSNTEGNNTIKISWDQEAATDVSEYRVYRRTADTQYNQSNYFTSDTQSYTDSTIETGTVYFYQVAAVNALGLVSDFSNETVDAFYVQNIIRTYDIQDSLYDNYAATTVGGDFNGDGVPDLCVGLPFSGVRKNQCGKVLIFYGNGSLSEPDVILYGDEMEDSRFGASLAAVDMNNDGFDELIVGAPEYDTVTTFPISGPAYEVGKIYIYAGGSPFSTTALQTFEGVRTQFLYNEQLGYALAAVGDANGDGYEDVAASAPYGGEYLHGRVCILYGGPNTYGGSTCFQGPNANMYLGTILAGAGDVNNDGYDDILAGGGHQDRSYLILGGSPPQLMDTIYFPSTDIDFNMAGTDVNGDGFSDLVVSTGIYLGASSVDASVDFSVPHSFGPFIPLGDLDSDGFQDLLVYNDILWGGSSDISSTSLSRSCKQPGCYDMDLDGANDVFNHDSGAEQIQVISLQTHIHTPLIRVDSPEDQVSTTAAEIEISGSVERSCTSFFIAGQQVGLTAEGQYTHTLSLHPGYNRIEFIAIPPQGNINKKTLYITCNLSTLEIRIDSALSLDSNSGLMRIEGTVNRAVDRVYVNGVAATLNGLSYEADITVTESDPMVIATATDSFGETASYSISSSLLSQGTGSVVTGRVQDVYGAPMTGVTVGLQDPVESWSTNTAADGTYYFSTENTGDATLTFSYPDYAEQTMMFILNPGQTRIVDTSLLPLPELAMAISSPVDGATIAAYQTTVNGNVWFNWIGGETELISSVRVNGVDATIFNASGDGTSFTATIPLTLGANTIEATATDIFNQVVTTSISVTAVDPPPVVGFSATPATVASGASSTLSWDVTGADTVSIDNGIGAVAASGTTQVTPSATTTYTLTASGPGGITTETASVTVVGPMTVLISANPDQIVPGIPSTLSWDVTGADTVSIDNGIGAVAASGTTQVTPTATTTYTLTATNALDTVTDSVTVVVNELETVYFRADPTTIFTGQTATLTWSCNQNYSDSVVIEPNIGTVSSTGSVPVTLQETTTFTLTANGSAGQATDSVTVTVIPYPAPGITFGADPATIAAGSGTALSWNVTYADTVSIDHGIGTVQTSDSLMIWPLETTTYTLTATGPGGVTTGTATVTVASWPQATISADPETIPIGGQTVLSWNSTNADSCSISPDIGSVAVSGTQVVTPGQTTTYTITATGVGGTITDSVKVTVADPPTATLTADRIVIDPGETVYLAWHSTGAQQCQITPGIGSVWFNGNIAVNPETNTLYTITATGAGGSAEAYVRIYVRNDENYGDPTPAEQVHIEAINRARANPSAEAARLAIDLNEGLPPGTIPEDAVQPLACSAKLLEAARLHARDMLDQHYFAHDSLDGRTSADRVLATGYELILQAENIGIKLSNDPIEEVSEILAMHDRLFIDADVDGRGHRLNILNADLKEVGPALARGPYDPSAYGALFACEFGTSSQETRPFLLGVVYDDLNGDGLYTAGEGLGDVLIQIQETGATTLSASAGGYRIALDPGQYTLVASLPDGREVTSTFTMADQNVKVDFALAPLPVINLSVDPRSVTQGESATLTWSVSRATSCDIDQGIGTVAFSGTQEVSPSVSTTYTLTATGPGGTSTASATVWIDDEAPTVVDITPANGSAVSGPYGMAVITVTVSDNESGFCSATLLDYQGNDVSYMLEIDGQTITWSVDLESQLEYTLVLEDCAGNTTTIPLTFTAQTAPDDLDLGLDPQDSQGGDFVGGAIRLTNGNVVESRADLSFASPNRLGFGFEAYYNSRSADENPLGHGWTHTYAASLSTGIIIDGQSLISIVDATGRARYFYDGSPFMGAFNEKSRLSFEGGQYIWHRLDGARFGFSIGGSLIWIDDPVGNRTELIYDAGSLSTVNDIAGGRTLTFEYTGNLITAIIGPATTAVPDGVWVSFGYDSYQNLTSVTYADGSGIDYTYADPYDPNNLTRKANKLGHLITAWTYNSDDRAASSSLPDDSGVAVNYLSGDQAEVTDAYGVARTYTIDQIGRRSKVVAMDGPAVAPYSPLPAIRWQYDEQLNLEEVEYAGGTGDSPQNTIHRFEDFDDRGNPQIVIQAYDLPEQRIIAYSYHPVLNTVLWRSEASVLDIGRFKETIYDYDYPADPDDDPEDYNQNPTSRVYRIIEKGYTLTAGGYVEPYSYVTAYDYNSKGQVISNDGPLDGTQDTTNYDYDPGTGDLTTITRPLVGATTYADYDAAGQPGTRVDVNGVGYTYYYDGRGRLIETVNQANGGQTISTYQNGVLEQSIDADGITTTYTYDPDFGRIDSLTDHQGNQKVYAYDTEGNLTDQWRYRVNDPTTPTNRRHWSFDHPEQPGLLYRAFTPDPNGQDQDVFTEYGYDLAGNVNKVTDPESNTTSYQYDAFNRQIQILQPGGGVTQKSYDSQSNLVMVTDAEGHETEYMYDDMGRLVTEISPDAGTTIYAFDAAGNLIHSTDGRGVSVTYTPDELGRTRQIDYPVLAGQSAYSIIYTYDGGPGGKGRLTAMSDASGGTTWDYSQFDDLGKVTKTSVIGGFSFETSQIQTPGGRMTQLAYPSGRVVDYLRAQCTCSISDVTTTYGGETTTLVADLAYQPFGLPRTMDMRGTGTANVDNRYSEAGVLTAANPDTLNARTYAYDNNGNQKTIKVTAAPWQSQTFTYDNLNRITSASSGFGVLEFDFDTVGNRLTQTQDGYATTYAYLPGTNRLDWIAPPASGTLQYIYDGHGNTIEDGHREYTYNTNNQLVRVEDDSMVALYVYNGIGQRVMKTVDGQVTNYHYDLDGRMIAETRGGGSVTEGAEYIYRGKNLLAQVDVDTGAIYSYHTNYLGAVHQLTDYQGIIVWEAVYQPFGSAAVNAGSTVVNNWRMPGQYYDEESGLHYNYHRYYDTYTGRYLTPDPIGLEGGINLYAYVQNNPVNFIDPEGLSPAGWVIRLTRSGFRKISSLGSTAAARLARRQGQNVLAPNRQAAKAIERGAFGGAEDVLRHKGHDLADGAKGMPHFQTPGKYGHTFWGGVLGFFGSLLDPFDAISGELANPEADMDGNGIPDYLEKGDNPCP